MAKDNSARGSSRSVHGAKVGNPSISKGNPAVKKAPAKKSEGAASNSIGSSMVHSMGNSTSRDVVREISAGTSSRLPKVPMRADLAAKPAATPTTKSGAKPDSAGFQASSQDRNHRGSEARGREQGSCQDRLSRAREGDEQVERESRGTGRSEGRGEHRVEARDRWSHDL